MTVGSGIGHRLLGEESVPHAVHQLGEIWRVAHVAGQFQEMWHDAHTIEQIGGLRYVARVVEAIEHLWRAGKKTLRV